MIASKESEQGYALVSVLWAVAILALLAAAIQTLTATGQRLERRAWLSARADHLLEAGVVRAVLGLIDRREGARWRTDGVPQDFRFEDAVLRVVLEDERGRIDLNAADGSLLLSLLRYAGANQSEAEKIVDSIVDWRNTSGLQSLHGATAEEYRVANIQPRHAPFQSVDELMLIPGMSADIFERAAPLLTIFSRSPQIDREVAGAEVRRFMAAVGLALADPGQPTAVLPATGPLMGRVFRIHVDTFLQGRRFTRETVVMLTGDPARPYLTLSWD